MASPTQDADTLTDRLWTLWLEVLGIDEADRRQTFFELGGDSVLVMVLLHKVEQEFGVMIDPMEFFETATVAAFEQRVRAIREPVSVDRVNSGAF